MGNLTVRDQRPLLFHCAFTCVYLPGILFLLKFNESLYNVGKYKFLPILLILMFAEAIKLAFSIMKKDHSPLGRIDGKTNFRSKKPLSRRSREVLKFFVAAFLISVVYYTMIVLLGAPLFKRQEETSMLALTLTILTFIAPCLHLGIDGALLLLTKKNPPGIGLLEKAISFNSRAALFGAWLGAIVIPLDWDRPWQAWPVPCVLGALVGYTGGHFVTLLRLLFPLRIRKKV